MEIVKSTRTRLIRLLAGIGILLVTLAVTFGLALAFVPHRGAMPEEVALALPGDDLAPAPLLNWTNAINIDAPPQAVWSWIAQLGDTRGGFYSYTFIEDRVGAIAGAPSQHFPAPTLRPPGGGAIGVAWAD